MPVTSDPDGEGLGTLATQEEEGNVDAADYLV